MFVIFALSGIHNVRLGHSAMKFTVVVVKCVLFILFFYGNAMGFWEFLPYCPVNNTFCALLHYMILRVSVSEERDEMLAARKCQVVVVVHIITG